MHPTRKLLAALLVATCALLTGCEVELYSGLSEREGNEMLAVLLSEGISSRKVPGKDQVVSLMVDEAEVARAVEILRRNGYPKDHFASIGDIFKKESLISSPVEERIRFIYALSQNVSETLSQIDGVLTARVHVVLPENKPFDENTLPSTASVFIKHRADSSLEEFVPKIKSIVHNSIEGLTYDKISVALFPAREYASTLDAEPNVRVLSLTMTADSVPRFWTLLGTVLTLLAAAIAVNGVLIWRWKNRSPTA